LKIKLDTSF